MARRVGYHLFRPLFTAPKMTYCVICKQTAASTRHIVTKQAALHDRRN